MYSIQTDDGVFTIDTGPPMRLSDGTNDWIIVTRPMYESLAPTSKKWYQNHPELPEPVRRLQAWLETELIDWLPLASSETHALLQEAIARHCESAKRKKLILRRAYQPKRQTSVGGKMPAYTIDTNGMLKPTATVVAKKGMPKYTIDNGSLQIKDGNYVGSFNVSVLPHVNKIEALSAVDPRVISFWGFLRDNGALDLKVVFAADEDGAFCCCADNLKINMDTVKNNSDLLAKLQGVVSESEDPKQLAELIISVSEDGDEDEDIEAEDGDEDIEAEDEDEDIEAEDEEAEDEDEDIEAEDGDGAEDGDEDIEAEDGDEDIEAELPEVFTQRVGEQDLPAKAWIQRGEIYGTTIEWCAPQELTLAWSNKCNLSGEAGIVTGGTNAWGFAGYEPTQSVYLRYSGALLGQEHCMRIVVMPSCEALIPIPKPNAPTSKEIDELFESADEQDTEQDVDELLEQDTEQDVDELLEQDDSDETDVEGAMALEQDTVVAWIERELEANPAEAADFITKLYQSYVNPDSDSSEKLNSAESEASEDSDLSDDGEMTNIAVTEVATLFCDLGIGLAAHFDLDTDEVIEYLDGVCEDVIGVNPDAAGLFQQVKELDEDEADIPIPTLSEFESWFKAPAKGGLKLTELRTKAKACGMEVTSKTTKQAIKDFLEEILEQDDSATEAEVEVEQDDSDTEDETEVEQDDSATEDEQAEQDDSATEDEQAEQDDSATEDEQAEQDDSDTEDETEAKQDDSDTETLSQSDIDQWFAPKGGLKLSELRTKAESFGIKAKGLSKSSIKNKLEEFVVPDDDEQDTNALTTDQVEIWFMTPKKGGLKLPELKEKAAEFGIEVTSKTKRQEIKEMLLELCDDHDEEADEEKTFKIYMEAPGTKKNMFKFWRCTVEEGTMTTSYGTVGNKGTSTTKSFNSNETAITAAQKLVQKKIAGGYSEVEAESQDDSDSENECHFVYTKGPQTGDKCTTKPKDGAMFCGKHKDCKNAKNANAKNTSKPKKETKSASTGQCLYVGVRGDSKNKQCEIKPKDGEEFCAKHANTTQATQYKANESPAAKKAAKKLGKETKTTLKGPTIVRNKTAKVWVVEGENLVVKSPNNPTVYAYLTKKGTVSEKLTKTVKTLAEELGLEIA